MLTRSSPPVSDYSSCRARRCSCAMPWECCLKARPRTSTWPPCVMASPVWRVSRACTIFSIKSLLRREAPEESLPGIILALVSLVVMPLLVRAKRKVARGISSKALMADSKQTELCTSLSAILLGGLLLNALLGWWWADPVAALVMVPIIAKEGIEALRGETCCDEGACH